MTFARFDLSRLSTTAFLVLLLSFSLATNVILIVKIRFPHVIQRARLALVGPPAPLATDRMRGNRTASVTVIEYSDFQCPFSRQFHQAMRASLGDVNVRWVYRHLPGDAIHPLAAAAAEAAECAGDQGRFWEYADALFDRQSELTNPASLLAVARDVGLDADALKACVQSRSKRAVVDAQREDAADRLIAATPTFFVNDRRFDGTVQEAELKKILAQAAQ